MKLYRNLAQAVEEALSKIFDEGFLADRVVAHALKSNPKWGSRDRAFVSSCIYEIVRYKRLFEFPFETEAKEGNWHLFASWLHWKGIEPPVWPELEAFDFDVIALKVSEGLNIRPIAESIPDWLDQLGVKSFGEEKWAESIAALNQEAPLFIRWNSLMGSIGKLQSLFKKEGVNEIERFSDVGFKFLKRYNLSNLQSFKDGWYEVQDGASQLIAPFMELKAGMYVIDACAGAGGKSLHIASLMGDKGKILSMDVEQAKLEELSKRAKRANAGIISTALASSEAIDANKSKADRVLLDVPCSGSGVFRRNPHSKIRLTEEQFGQLLATQAEILDEYSTMCKSGGILVYATCSILPAENDEQVERFLANHTDFALIEKRTVLPQEEGFDGFFMAKMART